MERNLMHLGRYHMLMLLSVPVLAIGLAACGSSSSSSTTSSTATSTGGAASTVSTKSISGVGTVLVDAKGDALYTNNQDSGSKIACTGSCTSIWSPLPGPPSGQPTSDNASAQAKLGVVKHSSGPSHADIPLPGQLTFGGKPLYTFVQGSPGEATGNGVKDSFGGTNFTWTAATAPGAAASPSATTSTGSSGGSY
jgi:predicted lipoprotein with Yx(FWY)xxD motif